MEPFGVHFGRIVRKRRGIEGLSQDDLASRSNLTKARISDIETGKIGNPQVKTVDALCVALNISAEEREGCYVGPAPILPPRLLKRLANYFGREMPEGTQEELEDFLMVKAEEFREMRERLKNLAEPEGRTSELISAAHEAVGAGEFGTADDLLTQAEAVQLQSSTVIALQKQATLRIERGNVALVVGDIQSAVRHFEQSSRYFSGVDVELEAVNRHECIMLLRYYGYRYRNSESLYAAKSALQQNLCILRKDTHVEKWCQAKDALGGVGVRLAEFDAPENAMSHLAEAKGHYEDVRAVCSETLLPKVFAIASGGLANVYSDDRLAKSVDEHKQNLQLALRLRLSALRFISKSNDSEKWGILQHNLGCSYIDLSNSRVAAAESVADVENAIHHLELSFEVRNPEDSLQFWVASCRSLAEALLNMSMYSIVEDAEQYVRRAAGILNGAAAKISPSEHPHQWREIQTQLERCVERRPA
jgi:transcriptional regulator with XRE-family HTH domain